MGKLGQDFELGYIETELLEKIRSKRGVKEVVLKWLSEYKKHMKWRAACNNPRTKSAISILFVFAPTPKKALQKLWEKLNQKL